MSQPDRSKLPIPRQPFAGVANKTLEGSQPDWEAMVTSKLPTVHRSAAEGRRVALGTSSHMTQRAFRPLKDELGNTYDRVGGPLNNYKP